MNDITRISLVAAILGGILVLSNLEDEREFEPEPIAVERTLMAHVKKREMEMEKPQRKVAKLSKRTREEYCMAKNIYHEAGVETEKGKIAVGQVTLNRVSTGRWGNSICEVVYSHKQFSWTLEPQKLHEKPKGPLWEESLAAAQKVFAGKRVKVVGNSLFYHTDYIKTPYWAEKKALIAQVGQHLFYTKARTAQELREMAKTVKVKNTKVQKVKAKAVMKVKGKRKPIRA
jgi:spore germination cell wall hydrolase CwlJ-like protein